MTPPRLRRNNYGAHTKEIDEMTELAKQVLNAMNNNLDAEQMLAIGIGSSVYEVEFIMEQIKIAHGQ